MKFIFTLFLLILLVNLNSCMSDNDIKEQTKAMAKAMLKTYYDSIRQVRQSCNKLLFKLYDIKDSSSIADPRNLIWEDSITGPERIKNFEKIFVENKNRGYYFCYKAHYSVTLYKDNLKIERYFVDTSGNKALIVDDGYQTSFLISLQEWRSFIGDRMN